MYNTSKKSVSEVKKNTLLDFNRRDELDDILAALNKLSEQITTINDNRITDKAQLDLLNAQIFSSPKQNNSPISTSPNVLDHLDDFNTNFQREYKNTAQRDRRKSQYDIALKVSPQTSNKTQFLYSPITSSLVLKYVTVGTFLSFWREYSKLQQQHPEQIIQLGNFLSSHVIDELVANQNSLSSIDLTNAIQGNQLNLDNDVIYTMLIKKISPRTKEIFIAELHKNLEFPFLPSGYMVTMSSYKQMYFALLEWVNKFITLYDILCTDLTCEHPQFRTRNGVIGILDSFLNPIPQQHGKKIFQALSYDQIKNMSNIKTEFIPVFMAFSRNIYEQYLSAHDLNVTVGMVPHYSKKIDVHPQKLSYLPSDAYTYDTCFQPEDYPCYDNDTYHTAASTIPDSSLSALPATTITPKLLPCFVMMKSGTCAKGSSCPFSHKKEHLITCWQTMNTELQSSPFNPKSQQQQSSAPRRQFNITSDSALIDIDSSITPIAHPDNDSQN